jgi:hypothetical protein
MTTRYRWSPKQRHFTVEPMFCLTRHRSVALLDFIENHSPEKPIMDRFDTLSLMNDSDGVTEFFELFASYHSNTKFKQSRLLMMPRLLE